MTTWWIIKNIFILSPQESNHPSHSWERVLDKALQMLQQANNALSDVSSSEVLQEVLESEQGRLYLEGQLLEISTNFMHNGQHPKLQRSSVSRKFPSYTCVVQWYMYPNYNTSNYQCGTYTGQK